MNQQLTENTEKTCMQFMKDLAAQGVDFTYTATNGIQTFKGSVDKHGQFKNEKVNTAAQSRAKIKQLLGKDKK